MPIDMALLVTGKFNLNASMWFYLLAFFLLLLLFAVPKLTSLTTLDINVDPGLVLKIPHLLHSLSILAGKHPLFSSQQSESSLIIQGSS